MNDDDRDDPEYIRQCMFGDEPDVEPPSFPSNEHERLVDELERWVRANYDDDPGMALNVIQALHDTNSTNRELGELLKACRDEVNQDSTFPLSALNALRDLEKTLSPKKRGRRSNAERDAKIADEYSLGLNEGKWDGQTDYLKQRHRKRYEANSKAAKSWLSTLLKRAEKLKQSRDI